MLGDERGPEPSLPAAADQVLYRPQEAGVLGYGALGSEQVGLVCDDVQRFSVAVLEALKEVRGEAAGGALGQLRQIEDGGGPLVVDDVGEQLSARLLEGDVAVVAAEEDDRQAGRAGVRGRTKSLPGTARFQHDDCRPRRRALQPGPPLYALGCPPFPPLGEDGERLGHRVDGQGESGCEVQPPGLWAGSCDEAEQAGADEEAAEDEGGDGYGGVEAFGAGVGLGLLVGELLGA